MKKFVAIAAALTASTVVHAAQKPVSIPKKKIAMRSGKNRIATTSLRTRSTATTKATTGAGSLMSTSANTAAVSENTSQQRTSVQQDAAASSQSSATRLAMPMATSTVESSKAGPRMIPIDNFKAGASLYYYGSSIATPLDSKVPDFYHGYEENDSQDRVSAEIQGMFGYKFHPNMTVSINPLFYVNPSNSSTGAANQFMEPGATALRLAFGKFVEYKNFKWNGDLRYYPGITEDLAATTAHYYRTGQNVSFKLSKDTTFAAYNTLRVYDRHATATDAYQFRFTASPTLEHQLNDMTGFSVSYNIDNRLKRGEALFNPGSYTHESNGPYIEVGASLDFIKNLNLNPYVDSYVRRPNFYGTRWGINVGWTIL